MVDLAGHVEIQRLLAAVEAVAERLSPSELELFRSLEAKYATPESSDPLDSHCLELLLRNVEIRAGFGIEQQPEAGRVIDLPVKKPH